MTRPAPDSPAAGRDSAPVRVPRDLLFGNPERSKPKISPDGRHRAHLAPDEGVLNVWLGPESGPARPLTKDRGRGIREYLWGEDGRSLLYLQDKDGDENWHVHQVDVRTGETRDLTPLPGVQAQLVATDPDVPDDILVALNERDPRAHDVWRVGLKDGSRRLEAQNPGDAVGWLADRGLRVRLHKAATPDGGTLLRLREGDSWRDFLSCGPDDALGAHGFAPGSRALYVESSVGRDTTALLEVALEGGAAKTLAEHPEADLGSVLLHPRSWRAQAAAFETDRRRWTVLDPAVAVDFAAFAAELDGDVSVVSRDDADLVWYLLVDRPDRSPAYWRWDREARKLSFLFSTRPKLDGWTLAPMRAVEFPARDGLRLRGYLTTPPGARGPLPLVLLVHGGPWMRDYFGFHSEAQWLASLGFACLQVNYRGSTGFGKRFLHAGDREWGAKMQDDLADAAAWAAASGLADPARIAIYGASYGGYAALAGAAFTPKQYRCAVDVVGPSNLITTVRSIPPYWEPLKRVFDLRVGDANAEPEFLRSRSPLFSADKIEIPLLIAQGANDPRVKQAESEQIVSALRAKGKPVEYLLFPDEGHGFARPENRLKFYEAAEAFLLRHL